MIEQKTKVKQYYLLTSKEDHLIFQPLEVANNHVKVEFCAVPSRKGRKPTIVKEFYWTTETSWLKMVKTMTEITKSEAEKYLTEGL